MKNEDKNILMLRLGDDVRIQVLKDGKEILCEEESVGHMRLYDSEKRVCSCGKTGCVSNYLTKSGFEDTAQEKLRLQMIPSNLREQVQISADDIIQYAKDGDKLSRNLVAEYCEKLGSMLAVLADLFAPDEIMIQFSFMNCDEVMMRRIEEAFDQEVYPLLRKIKITRI